MKRATPPLRVSVVVPAYNEERDLAECLAALNDQSVVPFEIVVVDNNSRDATATIARAHGARVVHEAQQGISYARTAGFNAARGDIIARTDADTIVCPDWVKAITATFADKNIHAVTGRTQIEELAWLPRPLQLRWLLPLLARVHAHSLKGPVLYGFNMAIRRDTWRNIHDELHDTHSASNEDVQLTMRVRPYGGIHVEPTMHVRSKVKDLLRIDKFSRYLFDDLKTSLSVRSRRK